MVKLILIATFWVYWLIFKDAANHGLEKVTLIWPIMVECHEGVIKRKVLSIHWAAISYLSYFLEDRLYRLIPKKKAELLLTARQSMKQNKSNITIKQRHETIRQELHPLLMEVKEKIETDKEKNGEKRTSGNMDLWEERGVIDEKKPDIIAINHHLYYSIKHLHVPHIHLGVSSVAYRLLIYKHEYYQRK